MLGTFAVCTVMLVGTEVVDSPAFGDVVGIVQHDTAHPAQTQPLSHGADIVAGGSADLRDGQHIGKIGKRVDIVRAQRGLRCCLGRQEAHGVGLAPFSHGRADRRGDQELFR